MATILIKHSVADYAAWREVYDSVDDLRTTHGVTNPRVWREVGAPGTIFVSHDFATLDAARGFAGDPGLGDAMAKAGVVGEPRIEFLEDTG